MISLGLALGLAATLVAARFLSTQLHGIRATDPLTYVFAALVLTGVGLLACYLPARRAARVEPMAVLRTE
jgi:putative ABC transport system permease protein